jgi:2-amino-4-hydroxy-6-hydroxymethyldihydropteridine diphosphokinase
VNKRGIEVGISLGSNLCDRMSHLRQARQRLAALPDVSIVEASCVYETDPVGVLDPYAAMPFLNAVLILETPPDVRELAVRLRKIEREAGRLPAAERNAPRPLDLDILYAGGQTLDDTDLQVPHPRWAVRRFVVQPLADMRPALVLPGQTHTVREILLSLPESPQVVLFRKDWQP